MGNIVVINVKDPAYGAVGNGLHDDTAAINLALAAVPASSPFVPGGAVVYFPQGNYLISSPLTRVVSRTHMLGESRLGTTLSIDPLNWTRSPSPLDSLKSFMLDLQTALITDCVVENLTFDGESTELSPGNPDNPDLYSGILCSVRNEIIRVSLIDIWGKALWIFGANAEHTKVIDCDADGGSTQNSQAKTSDCIGGGGRRTKIVRFHWMPGLKKHALDFTTSSGGEVSVDLVDCINESAYDVLLEGAIQSSVRGCRFYGNNLIIQSDANYGHVPVTNPLDILVADNVFSGTGVSPNPNIGGSCQVHFDGGDFQGDVVLPNTGGRIAILGNTFFKSYKSAIEWAGDIGSTNPKGPTSLGGSVIANNRIYNPNQKGTTAAEAVSGASQSLGNAFGCGIAILSSYGLTIGRNTIEDDNTTPKMQFSMQLITQGSLPSGSTTQPILVTENLCGNAPGAGNGAQGTFYFAGMTGAPNPSDNQPLPILHRNTNQDAGYDLKASTEISGGLPTGTPWPLAGGYPYDAIVTISGGSSVEIDLGVTDTKLQQGAFFLHAGQHINIKWGATQPTIKVFRI